MEGKKRTDKADKRGESPGIFIDCPEIQAVPLDSVTIKKIGSEFVLHF